MKLLIDAHALIWYAEQDRLFSPPAHGVVGPDSFDLAGRASK